MVHAGQNLLSGVDEDSFELERYPTKGDDESVLVAEADISTSGSGTASVSENASPSGGVRELMCNCQVGKVKTAIRRAWTGVVLPNIGILFLIVSQFFNSIMILCTKLLETDPEFDEPIHPLQILVVRMGITVIGCWIYLKYKMKVDNLLGPKEVRWLLVIRGLVGFTSVFSIYYSVMYISMSDAITITFIVPSVTGFLAWVILRERWSIIEAVGSLVSLFGVVLIARPTFLFGLPTGAVPDSVESSDPRKRFIATCVSLFGVLGTCFVYIAVRRIGNRVHSLITVQYFAVTTLILSTLGLIFIPGLSLKTPRTLKQWSLFTTLGVSGFFMQFLLTEGIMREKASRASSITYTQMIFAIFWEIVIWHHIPNIWSWLGGLIIIGSAFTVIYFKPKQTDYVKLSDEEATDQLPASER